MLSPEQIETFNTQGYLVVEDVVDHRPIGPHPRGI